MRPAHTDLLALRFIETNGERDNSMNLFWTSARRPSTWEDMQATWSALGVTTTMDGQCFPLPPFGQNSRTETTSTWMMSAEPLEHAETDVLVLGQLGIVKVLRWPQHVDAPSLTGGMLQCVPRGKNTTVSTHRIWSKAVLASRLAPFRPLPFVARPASFARACCLGPLALK